MPQAKRSASTTASASTAPTSNGITGSSALSNSNSNSNKAATAGPSAVATTAASADASILKPVTAALHTAVPSADVMPSDVESEHDVADTEAAATQFSSVVDAHAAAAGADHTLVTQDTQLQ